MSVMSDKSILNALKSRTLRINPFDPQGLAPATYDMRLHWKLLVSPMRHESGRIVDLRQEPKNTFAVEPGRFVGVLTAEVLWLPLSISGRFGLRSEFTRHGLIAFGGIQIDPGFHGRLAISLFHAGPEPMELVLNSRMFTVEFSSLDTAAERGYNGQFQDQYDFPSVQRHFILNAHTVSLAEIGSLPDEITSLRRRLTVHESVVHIVRRPVTLLELAAAQGVKPVKNASKLLGGWPAEDDFDAFLANLQSRRQLSH